MDMPPYVASDVLFGILAQMENHRFVSEPAKLHETFFQARSDYPLLKNHFTFPRGSISRFSRNLELALDVVRNSEAIEYDNDDYSTYVVTPKGKVMADEYLLMFTPEEQQQLARIAEVFVRECGVPGVVMV